MSAGQPAAAHPPLPAIAVGLMGMSDMYGPADQAESIATIHAALDAGVQVLDTADFYGVGHNELLLREALRGRERGQVRISVKFGILRDPAGGFQGVDTRPVAVRNSLAHTLRRLGTDYIDVYRPARFSPEVPVEDTVGAIAELVKAGYVRHIGLPDVDAATLRRAAAVHPIGNLQTEYSVACRGIEDELLPTVRELGIAVFAHGVLARGALFGSWSPDRTGQPGPHSHLPARHGDGPDRHRKLVRVLHQVAAGAGATVAQVAIAWALTRGPDIVPLVGAKRRDRLAEALGALRLRLSADDLARIETAVPSGIAAPLARPGIWPQPAARPRSDTIPLTEREAEVLHLVRAGMTNRAIANRLGISERTAREHVARILLKLRVESRVEAAVIATEWRLARRQEPGGRALEALPRS